MKVCEWLWFCGPHPCDKVPLFNFPRQTLLFSVLSISYYIECSADNFSDKLEVNFLYHEKKFEQDVFPYNA